MAQNQRFAPYIIKTIAYAGTIYLCYEIYNMYKYESKIKKLEALRQHKIKSGQIQKDDIEDDKEIKAYEEQHYGRRLLERMQSQHLVEEQIKYQLNEKKQLREKILSEYGEDQVKQIDEDIDRLNNLFTKMKPTKQYGHPAAEFINKKDNLTRD